MKGKKRQATLDSFFRVSPKKRKVEEKSESEILNTENLNSNLNVKENKEEKVVINDCEICSLIELKSCECRYSPDSQSEDGIPPDPIIIFNNEPPISTPNVCKKLLQDHEKPREPMDLNYQNMTVPQLKALCRERNMFVKGNKSHLIHRLVNNITKNTETKSPAKAKLPIKFDFIMGDPYHIDGSEAKSKKQPYKLTIKAKKESEKIPKDYKKIENYDNPDFWLSYRRDNWDNEGHYADLIVCLAPKRQMIFAIKKHSEMFKYPSGFGYECNPKCPITDEDAETYESGTTNPVYLHLKKHGFDVDSYLKSEAYGWNEEEGLHGPNFRISKKGYLTFQFLEEV